MRKSGTTFETMVGFAALLPRKYLKRGIDPGESALKWASKSRSLDRMPIFAKTCEPCNCLQSKDQGVIGLACEVSRTRKRVRKTAPKMPIWCPDRLGNAAQLPVTLASVAF